MSTTPSNDDSTDEQNKNNDLPQKVQHRLSELPDGVWAGELEDVECAHCGHNSWAECEDDLGYEHHWAHHVDAYECLYCGATGGRVVDGRQDTRLTSRLIGCMESTRAPTIPKIDPENPPWEVTDGDDE